jgi:hypothetical protein
MRGPARLPLGLLSEPRVRPRVLDPATPLKPNASLGPQKVSLDKLGAEQIDLLVVFAALYWPE